MIVGFVVGAILTSLLLIFGLILANEAFDQRIVPRGAGWAVLPILVGVFSSRLFLSVSARHIFTNIVPNVFATTKIRASNSLGSIGRSDVWRGVAIISIVLGAISLVAIAVG
jgi:hypothetical protein